MLAMTDSTTAAAVELSADVATEAASRRAFCAGLVAFACAELNGEDDGLEYRGSNQFALKSKSDMTRMASRREQ
jgi:hypothetical protein